MAIDGNSFISRTAPVFENVADERRHRLARLAGVCRLFGRFGFSEGLLGHITVRDPEDPDLLWVNPMTLSFRKVRVSDLVQVDHSGKVRSGTRPINPVGLLLHAAIHEARPELVAICHAHAQYGKAWSTLGRVIDPITQDSARLLWPAGHRPRAPGCTGSARRSRVRGGVRAASRGDTARPWHLHHGPVG